MRESTFPIVHIATLLLAAILFAGAFAFAGAQSQEPKPVLPATPIRTGIVGTRRCLMVGFSTALLPYRLCCPNTVS